MADKITAFTGTTLFGLILLGLFVWWVMNEKDNEAERLREQNNRLEYQHCLDLNREMRMNFDCSHWLDGR
ncbi:MAG: hypothetical protein R3B59_03595 [Dehalococcoidia bacterium]